MNMPGDALSDILDLVRLRACIYFVKDMPAPWGMDIPATPNGPLHMVLGGSCVLTLQGQEVVLNSGDAVLVPHGSKHMMLDQPSTIPEPGPAMLKRLMAGDDKPEGPVATRMLCGHFEWDGVFDHPLFRELPEVIVVRNIFEGPDASRLRSVVDLVASEKTDGGVGGAAIADRMGEVLFISLLRTWMIGRESNKGVLATIGDARLSRALRHMHEMPEEELNLDRLASVAGMSRTSFAVRFREAMGIPPATYLNEWRMLIARRLLLQSKIPISDVVERIGYGSEAAFSRAFKRRFGETPGRLRRQGLRPDHRPAE